MFKKYFQKISEKKENLWEKYIEEDIADRTACLTEITVELLNGDSIKFVKWIRENYFTDGVKGYCEWLMCNTTLTINEIIYNTKGIVKMTPVIIEKRLIKEEVKERLDDGSAFSHWSFKKTAREDELENTVLS